MTDLTIFSDDEIKELMREALDMMLAEIVFNIYTNNAAPSSFPTYTRQIYAEIQRRQLKTDYDLCLAKFQNLFGS